MKDANQSGEGLDTSHTEDSENQDPNKEGNEQVKETVPVENAEEPVEEEQKEMTLDEWKNLQKIERTKVF